MNLYILLFITVCPSYGMKWKKIDDFKDIFKGYSEAAENAITLAKKMIDDSREESITFLNNALNNNRVLGKVTQETKDNCFAQFIKKNDLEFSFQIQVFQLEVPLQDRIIDIQEKLNNINSTIDIYQSVADSKFWSCSVFNGSCVDETNNWLSTKIYNLSCTMQSNCHIHNIKKRSFCEKSEFQCDNGACISREYICSGSCYCNDCSNRPPGCVRYCSEFHCKKTLICVDKRKLCDGVDDCGDMSDELKENCPVITTTPAYTRANCSIDTGEFLCDTNKCIDVERVCDGNIDCVDGSDEGSQCQLNHCSQDCSRMGGFCLQGPNGPECLYECPPGTYETSKGCSLNPEDPPTTLEHAIEDIPRLFARHAIRFKYLKRKTMMELSRSMVNIVKCKRKEFTLLSKVIRFSSEKNIKEETKTEQSTIADKSFNPTELDDRRDISPSLPFESQTRGRNLNRLKMYG